MHIRVFHCDDSRPFTRLCWHWLSGHEDIEHVGAAHSLQEALATVAAARPDVVTTNPRSSPPSGASPELAVAGRQFQASLAS